MENKEVQLCESIRQGDKNSFEYVFRTYYGNLCQYASQILTDKDASEEVVQELFYQLWQKRAAFQVTTSLKSYLFRAVHNSCLNYIKHHKIKETYVQHYQQENSGIAVNQHQAIELKELQSRISRAVEMLPPERRKVFMMIRYEERKYKEVAELLGISVKTVENQMGKAMQSLRVALKDYLPVISAVIINILHFFYNSNR